MVNPFPTFNGGGGLKQFLHSSYMFGFNDRPISCLFLLHFLQWHRNKKTVASCGE